MEEDATRQLLQNRRMEMMAYLEDWMWRLEESLMADPRSLNERLVATTSLAVTTGPSSLKDSYDRADETPVPASNAEEIQDPERSRSYQEANRFGRMDSYALAEIADRNVTDAFDRIVNQAFRGSGGLSARPRCQKVQQKVAMIMDSGAANTFFTLLILTNSIYLGVHLEITAQNFELSQNPVFFQIHLIYAIMFTIEALLRMVGAGTFFRYIWGPNWHWNILDLFVVISSWVEMAVEFASGEARSTNTNLRIVRVWRIGRLARVLRIVRVVRLFRALRTLVASLMGT
ncbi:Sodium channel protein (Na(+) channel), partial [Durusdinium trenchii]